MKKSRFEFLPDLTPEEFESLKASIADRGVDVAIIVDQDGNIIDGFHRQRACDELGIYCPREVRHFETEAEKFEVVLRLNCRRRQLTRQQKRELIAAYLIRDPQIADNFLAEILGGVSKNTVAEVRHELEATCQIDKFEKLRGKDLKNRPSKYKKIIANTPKEAVRAVEIVANLPDNCLGKTLDVTSAMRRAKRQATKRQRQDLIDRAKETLLPDHITIHHCNLTDVDVPAGEVDLILTDVMWNDEAEQDWRDLGRMAMRCLKPDGLLATYVGQQYLSPLAHVLCECGLHYQTTFCGAFPHGSNAAEVNGVVSRWRPVPIFSKEPRHVFRKTLDMFDTGLPEKEWSHLQQTVKGARWLLEHLSDPGQLVVDPCLGTGTTALAVVTADAPRKFIGCDRNEEMVRIARHRVSVAHGADEIKELVAILEDCKDLGSTTSQQQVQNFWIMMTDGENDAFVAALSALAAEKREIYERLPEAVA